MGYLGTLFSFPPFVIIEMTTFRGHFTYKNIIEEKTSHPEDDSFKMDHKLKTYSGDGGVFTTPAYL